MAGGQLSTPRGANRSLRIAEFLDGERTEEEARELAQRLAQSPYRNFRPESDPYYSKRTPVGESEPVTLEDWKNFGKGLVGSVAGLPGDLGNLVFRDAPRAVASPLIDLFGGQQPEPLPPYEERAGTSDYIASNLGADMDSAATQMGLFGIPGLEDVGKKAAIAVANDPGFLSAMALGGVPGARKGARNIDEELQTSGQGPRDRVEANKMWSDGWDMYAFHEMDDEPILVESLQMLNNYTPDRLLGLPPTSASGIMARFTPSDGLNEAEKAIETRFAGWLDEDIDRAIAAYNELPATRSGKIISVDDARELDPDYAADRSLSAAVHEPSSAFSKELWARKLAEPGDGAVMLMSGGTGAGKTTGLGHFDGLIDNYHTVFDSNLQSYDKAVAKIEEALGTGRDVEIMHVWRDPVEAFSGAGGSALSRAMKNGGTGRTVPLEAHVATHVGSNRTVKEMAEHYADDDRVTISIIDNSLGKGQSQPADLSVIEDIDAQELMDEIAIELEKAFEEGRITERVYRGFKGAEQ